MTHRKAPDMNQILATGTPVFGRPIAPSDAFPGVKSILVRGTQRASWAQEADTLQTSWTRAFPDSFRPYLTCANDCCKGGGFEIRTTVWEMISKKETRRVREIILCSGHEGNWSRGTGRRCGNSVNGVVFEIEYEALSHAS